MRMIRSAGVLTLALIAAGCGEQQNAASGNRSAVPGSSGPAAAHQVYSGTGTVQSVTGDQVAIAHGPIAGIGWPAMTMTFTAPPDIAARLKAGSKVDFRFARSGSTFVLTSATPR